MAQKWRTVRVFISSTFRDMHAEREELVKRIFPQLRKLCEQRGVTWGEVDLRWGISDEQKAEGKVLPICLEEIQSCRPYFIGLLGERYGWVPDKIAQDLIQREPWLAQHRDHSVTELEILHGVLNNPEMADHAFFYFRSPAFIDSLPDGEQVQYRQVPSDEEVDKYGLEEAERHTAEKKRKLIELKDRICASGLPVRPDYPNPRSLGELVLNDLTGVIDQLYPAGSQPDPLDREAAEHEAFAASRARIYIQREEYFNRLDTHADSGGPPLVVLGESGCGKSAMLANWALRYRESITSKGSAGRQPMLLMHFIGASPYSTDWALMLRRIMGEFKRHFDIRDDIPDRPDELRSAFANWLNMAAARGRVILILDGLNQLEDRDSAPDLVWLPPQIPANVRLILSTLPGRPLDDLKKRGWPTLDVKPLDKMERQDLAIQYLGLYRKSLEQAQLERIAGAGQTSNPLYLRVLLEELRVWGPQNGEHETLNERIDHYLAADTVGDLYGRVLGRYEEDYERDRPGLVGDALSLVWGARRGLSEAELLELLGSDGEPLPRAYWSPLYLAAESSLVSRSGLIGFGHDYLRQAVRQKFLPAKEEQQAAHLRLADYFYSQDLGPRKVDELPWQLDRAESWQRLFALLADERFFAAAWRTNLQEVREFWSDVESNSPLRLIDAYRSVIETPGKRIDYISQVAGLLELSGHLPEALRLWDDIIEHLRQTDNLGYLGVALGRQGVILEAIGDIDMAIERQKESETICRQLGLKGELASSLGNRAVVLAMRGDFDEAMALHKEQEQISREIDDKIELQASLGNQGAIYLECGNLDAAMSLLRQQEQICRELGNKDGLSESLGNQAAIFRARGDLDMAMTMVKQVEQICRELGNRAGLCKTLGNQALILIDRGDLNGAIALCEEEERLSRKLGLKEQLASSLGRKASILITRGNPDLHEAMVLLKQVEPIYRELGYKNQLPACLNGQANILYAWGALDEALELYRESECICREAGDPEGLVESLYNQTIILATRLNRLHEALPLINEAHDLSLRRGLIDLARKTKPLLEYIRKLSEDREE